MPIKFLIKHSRIGNNCLIFWSYLIAIISANITSQYFILIIACHANLGIQDNAFILTYTHAVNTILQKIQMMSKCKTGFFIAFLNKNAVHNSVGQPNVSYGFLELSWKKKPTDNRTVAFTILDSVSNGRCVSNCLWKQS